MIARNCRGAGLDKLQPVSSRGHRNLGLRLVIQLSDVDIASEDLDTSLRGPTSNRNNRLKVGQINLLT